VQELANHFHSQGDRFKGVSNYRCIDMCKGVNVKVLSKLHPQGIQVWVAYPVDCFDHRLPIEVVECTEKEIAKIQELAHYTREAVAGYIRSTAK
jgi:hypothetical protein